MANTGTNLINLTFTAMQRLNLREGGSMDAQPWYLMLLSGIDGATPAVAAQVEPLLHAHPTYREAVEEAVQVLRQHGVNRIRVWNDPDHDLHSTIYRTYPVTVDVYVEETVKAGTFDVVYYNASATPDDGRSDIPLSLFNGGHGYPVALADALDELYIGHGVRRVTTHDQWGGATTKDLRSTPRRQRLAA